MERNTLTTIAKLQPGDRYYLASDKKCVLWTMLPVVENPKKTFYRTYKHQAHKDGMKFPQPVNGDTKVVFLRHSELVNS